MAGGRVGPTRRSWHINTSRPGTREETSSPRDRPRPRSYVTFPRGPASGAIAPSTSRAAQVGTITRYKRSVPALRMRDRPDIWRSCSQCTTRSRKCCKKISRFDSPPDLRLSNLTRNTVTLTVFNSSATRGFSLYVRPSPGGESFTFRRRLEPSGF